MPCAPTPTSPRAWVGGGGTRGSAAGFTIRIQNVVEKYPGQPFILASDETRVVKHLQIVGKDATGKLLTIGANQPFSPDSEDAAYEFAKVPENLASKAKFTAVVFINDAIQPRVTSQDFLPEGEGR